MTETVAVPDPPVATESVPLASAEQQAKELELADAEASDTWSWATDAQADLRMGISYGLPLMFAWTVKLSGGMLAAMLLGREKTALLAGISAAQVWCEPLDEFGRQFGTQVAALSAQAFGAGNYKLVGTWLQMTLILVTVVAVPVIWLKQITGDVLTFVGVGDAVALPAGEFATYTSFVLVFELYSAALVGYLIGQGILTADVVVSFFMVIFGSSLLWYLTAVAKVGVFGAAMCTSFRRVLHLVLLVYVARSMGGFGKCWETLKSDELLKMKRWKVLIGQVIPAGLQGALSRVSMSLCVALAARLGTPETAAYDLITQMTIVQTAILWGLSSGFCLVMTHRLGAGQPNRARGIMQVGGVIVYGTLAFLAICLYLLLPLYARMSSTDPEVIAAVESVRLFSAVAVLSSGALAGISDLLAKQGRVQIVVCTTAPCMWIIGLPLAVLLVPRMGLPGIFWGNAIGYGLAHVILLVIALQSDWVAVSEQCKQRSEVKAV